MSLKSSFTTDEEFELLEDRDATTSIIGYVDSILPATPAGKNNDLLFKFTMSNTNKRITVLIWGNLINQYHKEICFGKVLKINGGHCRAVLPSRFREQSNLVPYEIIIKENTAVSYMGYYTFENQATGSQFQQATFDTIHTLEGLVEICGYIRTKFSLLPSRTGQMTYAVGAITDGKKKITVQVRQFVKNELEIGDYVKVRGAVKGQDALLVVYCESMADITHDSSKDPLSEDDTQRGIRPVKRIHN